MNLLLTILLAVSQPGAFPARIISLGAESNTFLWQRIEHTPQGWKDTTDVGGCVNTFKLNILQEWHAIGRIMLVEYDFLKQEYRSRYDGRGKQADI